MDALVVEESDPIRSARLLVRWGRGPQGNGKRAACRQECECLLRPPGAVKGGFLSLVHLEVSKFSRFAPASESADGFAYSRIVVKNERGGDEQQPTLETFPQVADIVS